MSEVIIVKCDRCKQDIAEGASRSWVKIGNAGEENVTGKDLCATCRSVLDAALAPTA